MSLSKLDPRSTSGSSSQGSSDGQNPFSEKQHPLLQPTILDAVFPYLTLSEVKNSRLVCKPWGEVGIPFIGRRKLKPVKFSNINFEDFLALKQEFQDPSKSHPKLKLFQGFYLTWEQVLMMSYCNFMPYFQPSQLVISGKDVNDPSVSLRALIQSTVATLRDLTLVIKWHRITAGYFTFDLLQILAESGITLRRLYLIILEDNRTTELGYDQPQRKVPFNREGSNSILRQNLSRLLESQAPTLEDLFLKFKIKSKIEEEGEIQTSQKIKLATFPHLQTLTLDFDLISHHIGVPANFESFDFCVKFPNLLHLKLANLVLWEMSGLYGREIVGRTTFDLTRGHPLKKLNIISSSDRFNYFPIECLNKLGISFPLLEEFSVQDLIIIYGFPWVDTLRTLEICGPTSYFNFLSLKKLENLHYSIYKEYQYTQVIVNEGVDELINRLLNHYTQLPHLKKFHLSGFNISPEEMKIQIQEVLPAEFRAILTID